MNTDGTQITEEIRWLSEVETTTAESALKPTYSVLLAKLIGTAKQIVAEQKLLCRSTDTDELR